jgi:cytochrome oxidase Cu insertion factor (SCO1/SenC/PrrC family)
MNPLWVRCKFKSLLACATGLLLALMPALGHSAPQTQSPPAATARLDALPQQWLDDRGKDLSLANLVGHRVILTMAYASCHKFCPTTLARLGRLQRSLDARGEQAEFVIVGYDPDTDGPATWHQYRVSRRLERGNWHFLTGSTDTTAQLARQLGFEFWKYDEHVMHDIRVVVFDAHGVLTGTIGANTRDWSAAL